MESYKDLIYDSRVKVFVRFKDKEIEVPVSLCPGLFNDPVCFNFFVAGFIGFDNDKNN